MDQTNVDPAQSDSSKSKLRNGTLRYRKDVRAMSIQRVALTAAIVIVAISTAAYFWGLHDRETLPTGLTQGNGRIEAEQIDIASKISGRVMRVLAEEGGLVEAGATLVEMDSDELAADLDRAKAEVALARQTRAEAQAIVI
ncbi:MAG: biotin/lipoyl-binding protein, partial [Pseudomonadota bacterium]